MGNKASSAAKPKNPPQATSFYELKGALDIHKQPVDFGDLKGKVVLCVNVSSFCGYTAQSYKEFATINQHFDGQDFVIVAFPCNQFANQEPGTNEEIQRFAEARSFKGLLMDKIKVNGGDASPVYDFLKVASGDESPIPWNFTKFIIRRDGTVYGRYGPRTSPCALVPQIEECLKQPAG